MKGMTIEEILEFRRLTECEAARLAAKRRTDEDLEKIKTIIHPKNLTGEYIASYIRAMQNSLGSNVETLYKLNDDAVEALEFRVRSTSRVTGIPLQELNLKDNLQVISINRHGKIILPQGSDKIMCDDTVVVITKHKGLSDLDDILKH